MTKENPYHARDAVFCHLHDRDNVYMYMYIHYCLVIGRVVNTESSQRVFLQLSTQQRSSDAEENVREHAMLLKQQNEKK